MREFMDYIQSAFYAATAWNRDNSYASLNATSDALLGFPTPRGVRVSLASLATPHFATAYQLGTVGVVDGSISYLFSSVPLHQAIAQSDRIPLPDLLRSYRPLTELPKGRTGGAGLHRLPRGWRSRDVDNTLAYGRIYLPMSMLEALVIRRISPALQVQVSAVSSQNIRNGGTVLGMAQYDDGRYDIEGLASTDGGLLGIRGLYNFGGDAENLDSNATTDSSLKSNVPEKGNGHLPNSNGGTQNGDRERIYGRFSTGAELYYGTLNKSGGISFGARFATLPSHNGTPLTATMTINPLIGGMSWTYAVMAGRQCSLATKMSFNVYSYESEWAVGMELWRKKGTWTITPEAEESEESRKEPGEKSRWPPRSLQAKLEWRLDERPTEPETTAAEPDPTSQAKRTESPLATASTSEAELAVVPEGTDKAQPLVASSRERSFQAKMGWRLDDELSRPGFGMDVPGDSKDDEDEYSGVLKARLDQHLRVGLLWEGRVKSLLFSLGSGIDLRRLDSPFRTLGLEVQFSS